MEIEDISLACKHLVKQARRGVMKTTQPSTFTISNLGMFGVQQFLPIINPPEAAILAVGAAKEVPVVEQGELKGGLRMKATVSVDHRVSDGAEAARFMQTLTQFLEEPLRLLL